MSCEADGCGLLPSFAPKGDRLPRTCSNHRGLGWVNVRSTTCFVDGCFKRPGFGLSKPVSCKEHSLPGYKSCGSRTCEVETCSKQPSYGPPVNQTGKRKSYRCRNHAIAADVQNRDKRNKSYGLPAPQFRHLVPAGPARPPAFNPIAPPPPANLPQPGAGLPQPGAGLPQAPVPPPATVPPAQTQPPPAHPLPPPAADDPPAGDNATAAAAADVAEPLPPADLPDLGDEAPGEFPAPPDPPNPPTPTATAPIASPAQQDHQQPKQATATARRNVVVVDSAYRVDLGPVPTYTFTSTPRAVGRPFSGHSFVHASPPPMISLDRKRVAEDHSTRAVKRQRVAGYIDDDESPDGGWAMGAAALTGGADGADGGDDDGSYSEYEYEYEYDDGEGL